MSPAHRGRPIETVEDVRGVIASGYGSVSEYLECIAVARRARDPKLAEHAGTLLLTSATGKRTVPSLEEAARAVIVGYLAAVSNIESLGRRLDEADAALVKAFADRAGDSAADKALRESRRWLDELRVLSNDRTAASLVALCSRLREIDRSDLGIEAASAALELDESAAAYTTRAAAQQDLGHGARALTDIRRAWKLSQSAFVANAYSRILLAAGRPDLALEKAEEAFEKDPSDYSAHSLIAAAVASSDDAALERAKGFIASRRPEEEENRSVWVELVAVKALMDVDKLAEAHDALLLLENDGRATRSQTQNLRGRLRTLQRRRQGRLGL